MGDQPDRRFRPPTMTIVYVALGVPAPSSRELICNRCRARRDIDRFNYAASPSIADAYWLPCLDCSDWDGPNRDYWIAAAIERQEHPGSDGDGGCVAWPVQTGGQVHSTGDGARTMNGGQGYSDGAASMQPAVGHEMSDLTGAITPVEDRHDDDSNDTDDGIQILEVAERSDEEFIAANPHLATNPLPIPTQSGSFSDHEAELPAVPQNSPDTVDALPTSAPLPTQLPLQPELQNPVLGHVLNPAAARFQVRQVATTQPISRAVKQANRRAYFRAIRQTSNQNPGLKYNGSYPGDMLGPLTAAGPSAVPGIMTAPQMSGPLSSRVDPNRWIQPHNLPQPPPLNLPPALSTSQPTTQPTRARPFLFPPATINTGPRPRGQSPDRPQVVSGSGFLPDHIFNMIDGRDASELSPHQIEALIASAFELSPAPLQQIQVSQPVHALQTPPIPTLAPLKAGGQASGSVDVQPSTIGERSDGQAGLGARLADPSDTRDEGEPGDEEAGEENASGGETSLRD